MSKTHRRFLEEDNIFGQKPSKVEDGDLPIFYLTEINQDSFIELNKKLNEVESLDDVTDFFIFINSYGGEVVSCLSMVEAIKNSPKTIHTVCTGLAASAAGVILSCGDVGNRWMTASSFFHAHNIQTSEWGSLPVMKEGMKFSEEMETVLFKHLVDNTNLTVEKLRQEIKDHHGEWHLSAKKALELEIIDRIGMPKFKTYQIFEYEG